MIDAVILYQIFNWFVSCLYFSCLLKITGLHPSVLFLSFCPSPPSITCGLLSPKSHLGLSAWDLVNLCSKPEDRGSRIILDLRNPCNYCCIFEAPAIEQELLQGKILQSLQFLKTVIFSPPFPCLSPPPSSSFQISLWVGIICLT